MAAQNRESKNTSLLHPVLSEDRAKVVMGRYKIVNKVRGESDDFQGVKRYTATNLESGKQVQILRFQPCSSRH
jgi:hypothetical protein